MGGACSTDHDCEGGVIMWCDSGKCAESCNDSPYEPGASAGRLPSGACNYSAETNKWFFDEVIPVNDLFDVHEAAPTEAKRKGLTASVTVVISCFLRPHGTRFCHPKLCLSCVCCQ